MGAFPRAKPWKNNSQVHKKLQRVQKMFLFAMVSCKQAIVGSIANQYDLHILQKYHINKHRTNRYRHYLTKNSPKSTWPEHEVLFPPVPAFPKHVFFVPQFLCFLSSFPGTKQSEFVFLEKQGHKKRWETICVTTNQSLKPKMQTTTTKQQTATTFKLPKKTIIYVQHI